jgi:hypothetical protein
MIMLSAIFVSVHAACTRGTKMDKQETPIHFIVLDAAVHNVATIETKVSRDVCLSSNDKRERRKESEKPTQ